jgi:Glycosyltransferase family 87
VGAGLLVSLTSAASTLLNRRAGLCCDDFLPVYWAGGGLIHGRNPYARFENLAGAPADSVAWAYSLDGTMNYPPPAALLGAVFSPLPYPIAGPAFQALSLLALVAAWWYLGSHYGWSRRTFLATAAATALFFPVWRALGLRNTNVLVVAALLAAAVAAARGRSRPAGLLLGAVISVKLLGAPLLIYYLWRRRYAVIGWAALGGAALVLAALLAPRAWPTYLGEVLPAELRGSPVSFNVSVPAQVHRLFVPGGPGNLFNLPWAPGPTVLALSATAVAVSLWRFRRGRDEILGASAILALVPLLSSVAWSHYAIFAIPAYWGLLSSAVAKGPVSISSAWVAVPTALVVAPLAAVLVGGAGPARYAVSLAPTYAALATWLALVAHLASQRTRPAAGRTAHMYAGPPHGLPMVTVPPDGARKQERSPSPRS